MSKDQDRRNHSRRELSVEELFDPLSLEFTES